MKSEWEVHHEYQQWLTEVYSKGMTGKKKRNNKAKRKINPADLCHPNELIRTKAKKIYAAQQSRGSSDSCSVNQIPG